MMTQQRHAQRRQILAMIGVTPWVGRESVTANLQEIMAAAPVNTAKPLSVATTAAPSNGTENSATENSGTENSNIGASLNGNVDSGVQASPSSASTSPATNPAISAITNPASVASENLASRTSPSSGSRYEGSADTDLGYEDADYPPLPDEITPKSNPIDPQFGYFDDKSVASSPVVSSSDFADEQETQTPIEPFTLQGFRYNNWVLLVDSAALTALGQKLWQNMQVGLSSRCESLAFPFCKTMSTLDMANASLAGFVFKLGGSEQIQVAALTDLPEGLDHEQMVRAPLLEEMLAEPAQKRQLWQLLCA